MSFAVDETAIRKRYFLYPFYNAENKFGNDEESENIGICKAFNFKQVDFRLVLFSFLL